MSIESALRELGKAIQADERYLNLRAATEENKADMVLQDQIQELQLLSLKFQQESSKGEETSQEKLQELQNQYQDQYQKIMSNENMKAYNSAADELDKMTKYITQMLGLFLDGQDPETCELTPESCTHDCSTCGGCSV